MYIIRKNINNKRRNNMKYIVGIITIFTIALTIANATTITTLRGNSSLETLMKHGITTDILRWYGTLCEKVDGCMYIKATNTCV